MFYDLRWHESPPYRKRCRGEDGSRGCRTMGHDLRSHPSPGGRGVGGYVGFQAVRSYQANEKYQKSRRVGKGTEYMIQVDVILVLA